jgi:PHS family inorganic phosphate transporter-like MFS transporter
MVGVGNPVLRALDKAQTQSYHFKAIIIAGMGFFTDAYDLFVIGLLTRILGRIYYYDPAKPNTVGTLPPNVNSAVTAVALCGTLAGQLFFGWAGDRWGRKKVYGFTLALMIFASICQGLSFGHTATSVITTLCFFRFWLGFGIGGDYPLSSTIMSEYSNSRTRGAFVAAVFAMQGVGYLVAAAVVLAVVAIFNNTYPRPRFNAQSVAGTNNSTAFEADWVWRIVLMLGAVPAALTFYSRSKMPETARYTALVERDQRQAALDMERVLHTNFEKRQEVAEEIGRQRQTTQFGLLSRQFLRRHGKELFATSFCWFLLDISYYSQNLFQNQIFTAAGWVPAATHLSALEETYKIARGQAFIAMCGTVPGYWFTVAFVDVWGRRPIQIMGFTMMSIFMYVLAFDFYGLRGHWHTDNGGYTTGGNHIAFIILYGLTFFFSNFGPNATTFIIPSELFPARLRSTCSGIAAACGKAGSIIGTFGFIYASQDAHNPSAGYSPGIGYKYSFLMLAICSTVGAVVSFLFTPETKGRSLEDLSGEDDENNAIADGDLENEHEKGADGIDKPHQAQP